MIKCALCDKSFKNRSGLAGHVVSVHDLKWAAYKSEHSLEEEAEAEAREETSEDDSRVSALETSVQEIREKIGLPTAAGETLPIPLEEVTITGHRVNYRVSLNPEVLTRYHTFLAAVAQLGKKWSGDFGDFLDVATDDLLTRRGIIGTVVQLGRPQHPSDTPLGVE